MWYNGGMKRHATICAIVAPALLLAGSTELEFDNDFLADDDSDFTHGTRITYNVDSEFRVGVAQSMYTPYRIDIADPPPGRHVYAGTLVGFIGNRDVAERDSWSSWNDLELQLGVLGPSSHAEETQKTIHRWLGCRYPAGWEHQLHDEAIVQLVYWKGVDFRLFGTRHDWSLHWDVEAGGMLGTFQIAPGFNTDLKAGWNVDGAARTSEMSVRGDGRVSPFRAYILGGLEGRWWLRNELLDGNAGYVHNGVGTTTDKEPLTGCLKAGCGVGYKGFDARFVYMWWTREFETQETTPDYAAMVFTFGF